MKLPINWLKEYIKISKKPSELAELLTMSGSEVEGTETVNGSPVFELEITPNRPDCLSVIGLAREVSALTGVAVRLPEVYKKHAHAPASRKKDIKICIENKKLCSFYTARVINSCSIRPSGKNIIEKITSMGLRPVNNVVDLINFCLFECGQPMHAFDMDKIRGNTISVREARRGETILTIDGTRQTLSKGMLIIADSRGPIAIAGIMGGKETEVTESTKNVLLESAYFEPASVRATARKLGLSSDSSYRFERGVDPSMIAPASERATALILEAAAGKKSGFYTAGAVAKGQKVIHFDCDWAGDILGTSLKKSYVTDKLTRLGLRKMPSKGGQLLWRIPSFRRDLNAPVDLLEEVARIYGFDNIEPTIPGIIGQTDQIPSERLIAKKAKESLAGCGYHEILTYSLIGEEDLNNLGVSSNTAQVYLENALSKDHALMRPTLMPGLLRALNYNIRQNNSDIRLFEISTVYHRQAAHKYQEGKRLVIAESPASYGAVNKKSESIRESFGLLKGAVEEMLKLLKVNKISFEQSDTDIFEYGCALLVGGKNVGHIGVLKSSIAKAFSIKTDIICADIDFGIITDNAATEHVFKPLSKYGSVTRDISVLIDKDVPYDHLRRTIAECRDVMIEDFGFLSMYTGKEIAPDKKNYLIRIHYHNPKKTLTDDEVNHCHERVKEILKKEFTGLTYR